MSNIDSSSSADEDVSYSVINQFLISSRRPPSHRVLACAPVELEVGESNRVHDYKRKQKNKNWESVAEDENYIKINSSIIPSTVRNISVSGSEWEDLCF